MENVKDISFGDNSVTITLDDGTVTVYVVAPATAPQTITLARPSLDDVFLRQTGRSLREEAKPAA